MDTGAGRFKPADLAYPSIIAPTITWYCVGDLDGVRALLSRVPSIGKATNKGYGRIMRWEVEPHAADISLAYDGELMRALPPEVARPLVAQPERYYERKHGLRPPYHHASRRATVWVPSQEVLSLCV
jgi:CRISPR type IV-associated protein Csf3